MKNGEIIILTEVDLICCLDMINADEIDETFFIIGKEQCFFMNWGAFNLSLKHQKGSSNWH
jgi:hypothetical protein